jgi:hypothetical protein
MAAGASAVFAQSAGKIMRTSGFPAYARLKTNHKAAIARSTMIIKSSQSLSAGFQRASQRFLRNYRLARLRQVSRLTFRTLSYFTPMRTCASRQMRL